MDQRESVLIYVIRELSSPHFFYDFTIYDAIAYVCHRQGIFKLLIEDRDYIHDQVIKFFKERVNESTNA